MSALDPSVNHPTVAELALLERQGAGARPFIAAMSDEQLHELHDRLDLTLATVREARGVLHDERVDDLYALDAVVRATLRRRTAVAAIDELLRYVPR